MRDKNAPIPGFEDEFTGTVGHEKRVHRFMFQGVEKTWRSTPSYRKWYRVGRKEMLLTLPEAVERGIVPEVYDEQKKV